MSDSTSIPIAILTPRGLIDAPYSVQSLSEAETFEPSGVYTTGRTFNRVYALMFDEHLNRLEESARLAGIAAHIERSVLRRALRVLIDRAGYAESRFRLTIPRNAPDQMIISLEPFAGVPPEVVENGVRVATLGLARHDPVIKSTDWMAERKQAAPMGQPGIYEGILVSPAGELLEGTGSNFYAVMDGKLYTAGEGVLNGITRRAILKIAPDMLPVELRPVNKSELWALEEAFLTSASRGVIPIVMIDEQIIANGRPGVQTMWLREAYDEWAAMHIEPL